MKDSGQLYTMEGIAAGLIMLITAYLVLSSTSVYTPGDTHITDMQLEQVGSDILRVMDTQRTLTGTQSDLQTLVATSDSSRTFTGMFLNQYLYNSKVIAKETAVGSIGIQINASVWYQRRDGSLWNYTLATSPSTLGSFTGKEPGVVVTHWVHLDSRPTQPSSISAAEWARMRNEPQEVLVEVDMWKV